MTNDDKILFDSMADELYRLQEQIKQLKLTQGHQNTLINAIANRQVMSCCIDDDGRLNADITTESVPA